MIERILGPISGYYIASYACEMGELGEQYLGFAKLCRVRPQDYWQASACAKFSCEELAESAERELEIRQVVDPPADQHQAAVQSRRCRRRSRYSSGRSLGSRPAARCRRHA